MEKTWQPGAQGKTLDDVKKMTMLELRYRHPVVGIIEV